MEFRSRGNWQLSLSLHPTAYSSYFDPGIRYGTVGMPRILFNVDSRKTAPRNAGLRDDIEDN